MNRRFKKFLSYYKPYWGLLVIDLVCAFIVSAILLIIPLCVQYITKNILAQNLPDAIQQILWMGLVMLTLLIVNTICNGIVDYRGHMMGAMMESDMRRDLFDHYLKLPFGFYDEQKTGDLMSRITNDLFNLSELYHHGPEDLAISIFTFIGSFLILMTINAQLTVIIFLFLPIMGVYAVYFNRRMNKAVSQSRKRIGDVNAQVEDSLAGIRVVKSFTNEAVERRKFTQANQRFLETRSAWYLNEAIFSGGMIAFTQLIMIAVIVFGGIWIANSTLELADLLTYVLFVGIMIEPIKRIVNFARLYQEGISGFNRFMDILEIKPTIQDRENAIALHPIRGDITFNQVSFKYQDDHKYVINNISLSIQQGDYVAFVGLSGAGKTTLCSLIPRFYDVTDGQILIDGHDICDIRLASLRGAIGVVQQDVYLFAGTVMENIYYGKPDATHDEIINAAKQANAHDFIMALPDGYDTDIGQRGIKLSGGQKQRLSITRVFLKNPPIIIFDEATSSLDNESEKAVQESLEALARNRTTIVIAHRLTTIQNAKRILVLGSNGIEEEGTHEELMARAGLYAKLYAVQLKI